MRSGSGSRLGPAKDSVKPVHQVSGVYLVVIPPEQAEIQNKERDPLM